MTIRDALESDLPAVAEMLDDFTRDHISAHHPRPLAALRAAFLGDHRVATLLVAALGERVVGMVQYTLFFDPFWAAVGVQPESLYVRPAARGTGLAAALVAEVCARGRLAGAVFLRGGAMDPSAARLYERVATGGPSYECHVSSEAFQVLADLAGQPLRAIVRGLPAPALSRVPARPR